MWGCGKEADRAWGGRRKKEKEWQAQEPRLLELRAEVEVPWQEEDKGSTR